MTSAGHAVRAAIAGIAAALVLAGCGGGSAPPPSPRAAATPDGAAAAAPPRAPKLLYVWRNFEETGVPEELTIYRDGALRYRNLLHTQMGIKVISARLRPAQLAALRRLVRAVDLRRADASAVTPRRDGFRWVLRRKGRVGTAADGHLHGPVRRLVKRVGPLMDRLQSRSLG
jgi:hypothetical protein